MDVAVKISALAVCAALCALLLKKSNAELALCLALAAGAVLLIFALELVGSIAGAAQRAREMSGLSSAVFSPVLKCVAVGIICSLAGEACRDSGSSLLANAADIAGAVCALFCALPLMTALLDTVEALL